MGSRILDFPAASFHVPSVLLDTSVLIYYLEGIEPYNLLTVVEILSNGEAFEVEFSNAYGQMSKRRGLHALPTTF